MRISQNSPTSAIVVFGALLIFAFSASSASADSPWWHLSSGARPTVLPPGMAKNEVQELTVSATEGDVLITNFPVHELEDEQRTIGEVLFAVVPYNASEQQVQKGLEEVYPGRELIVSKGKSKEENSRTYIVTFPGQATAPINANGNSAYVRVFGGERLGCGEPAAVPCREEASVAQISEGRPDGGGGVTAANLGDADVNGGCGKVTEGTGKYTNSECTEEAVAPSKGEFEKHTISIVDKLPPGLKAV